MGIDIKSVITSAMSQEEDKGVYSEDRLKCAYYGADIAFNQKMYHENLSWR